MADTVTESMLQRRPETPPNRITLPTKHILPPPSSLPHHDPVTIPHSLRPGHLNLETFSPVNQNGSFEFDRVLKSAKVHQRVKKKGAFKPSWKPAQLVLRPNILSLYKDEDATELWASINLSDVTAVAPVRKTNTQNVFGIFSPSKNYHFQGLSTQDSADWVMRIRKEAPIDADEEFFLASPENKQAQKNDQSTHYETSDLSDAFDERTSSPEPSYGSLRARKGRSRASTAQRIPSQIHEYSGNEMMTSYSDFSDTAPAGSLAQNKMGLSPGQLSTGQSMNPPNSSVTAATSPPSRPNALRNASQVSIHEAAHPNNPYPSSTQTQDPSRVIKQGWLLVLRRSSGVRTWKRLWVVLRPKSLCFYKTEAEYAVVKLIDVSTIINAADIDPVSRNKTSCFQVILEDKTYRFACSGEEDLNAWLGSLKSVLVRMKRERGKSEPGTRETGIASTAQGMSDLTM